METKTLAQKKIKKALVELINTQGLDSITVSDIARKASINRGTFYLHYLDKFDLVSQLQQELIETIITIVNQGVATSFQQETSDDMQQQNLQMQKAFLDTAIATLSYIYQEKAVITALLSDNGDPAFYTQFKEYFIQRSLQQHRQVYGVKMAGQHNIPHDYIEEMFTGSMAAVVLHWLKKGAVESPEQIAQILFSAPFFQ